jgi:hypothetical protein
MRQEGSSFFQPSRKTGTSAFFPPSDFQAEQSAEQEKKLKEG